MTTGLVTLVAPGSTPLTVTRSGHSITDPITVSAPATLDHMHYTLSSSTATVGGSAPTGTVTKWQDAGETTPFTGAVSLSYTSSAPGVATINSSTGVITLVAAGSCTFTVTDSISSKAATTGTLTVSTAGTYAWSATSPDATALVADWPGKDYASVAAIQSNALGRYGLTSNTTYYPGGYGKNNAGTTNISLDSGTLYGGYPSLYNDLTLGAGAQVRTRLTIPSYATQADVVYHRRGAVRAVANDVVPGLIASPAVDNPDAAIMALAFNEASYAQPHYYYQASGGPGRPVSGIILDRVPVNNNLRYRLTASVYATNGTTLLSDSTSVNGVLGCQCGDEAWDQQFDNVFLRAQLSGASLICTAYYNVDGAAPKVIATVTMTMADSSVPPMPKYAMPSLDEGYIVAPAGTWLAWHQVLDNATHPNVAMDFTSVTNWGTAGRGHHAVDWGHQVLDLTRYASDTAFKADYQKRWKAFASNTADLAWQAADSTHYNLPYVKWTQPAGGGGAGVAFPSTSRKGYDVWFREFVRTSPTWTPGGSGTASNAYKMLQLNPMGNDGNIRLEVVDASFEMYRASNNALIDHTKTQILGCANALAGSSTIDGCDVTTTWYPETDQFCAATDGSQPRSDTRPRVYYYHAHEYIDTDGFAKLRWEVYIGFGDDAAPYFYAGTLLTYVSTSYYYGFDQVDFGENFNQTLINPQWMERWGYDVRAVEQFGSDPFGVIAARASAAPKPVLSQVNRSHSGTTVVNTVKPYLLTTKLRPVIDGVPGPSDGSQDIDVSSITRGGTIDITHTGQTTGTHTYSYTSVNANGTTAATVAAISVTV